jgi:hypothetical protein
MSSGEKNANFSKNRELVVPNGNTMPLSKEEEKPDNNQLIKPIPINRKIIINQKNDINTFSNSSVKINNNPDSSISVRYPMYSPLYSPGYNSNFVNNDIFTFYHYKSLEIQEKNENNNNIMEIKEKPCCNCTKTKCMKKYCECFANKRFCKDCHCQDCMNRLPLYNNSNNNMRYLTDTDLIICTCTKSNCNKKYCECYKAGKKCNEKCRCLNCMNSNSSNSSTNIVNNNNIININENKENNNDKKESYKNNNIISKNNSVEEINVISRKSSSSLNINNGFKIQRISVFINRNQTLINVEKFSKEEMNLLSKKRSHS